MNDVVWIGAFRYYLGRRTYAVSEFVGELIASWSTLPSDTQKLIQRELEKAVSESKTGDDCDREDWEKVRALYRGMQ